MYENTIPTDIIVCLNQEKSPYSIYVMGSQALAMLHSKHILHYGKFHERVRWTKSRAVIGYPYAGASNLWSGSRDYPLSPAKKYCTDSTDTVNPLLTELVSGKYSHFDLALRH